VRVGAIQADEEFWEYPDVGFVQILETGEMDDNFTGEFCLIA
jgi:hypothetical protein